MPILSGLLVALGVDVPEGIRVEVVYSKCVFFTWVSVFFSLQVSIVFHSAATVKFDEVLKVSVTMNVKGTQSLLHLAKRMRNLEVRDDEL